MQNYIPVPSPGKIPRILDPHAVHKASQACESVGRSQLLLLFENSDLVVQVSVGRNHSRCSRGHFSEATATHTTKTDVRLVCCSEFEYMAPDQVEIHNHHDCAARCQLRRPLLEFKSFPMIASTSSKSIITSASTCGVNTIYLGARGPGRVWGLVLGALEVTKRDSEKHGTGDNYVYKLEEYITVVWKSLLAFSVTPSPCFCLRITT